jgi:phosphopantothenoylcysteine decarboxylase / phosphopantothenate---cysteine ligase
MKKILMIITGSVSAFKSLELIRMLKKEGYQINVILSQGGENFVTPLSVSALSENEVFTQDTYKMEHISLSRSCDLIVICPASASFINKLANGIGGDLALDLMLAKKMETSVIICPAMNVEMWNNKTVKQSIENLKKQGFKIVDPQKGELLCKEQGEGKLAPLEEIKTKINNFFAYQNTLKGLKFVITSGGTVEKIDDVRFISNFSSGLQGALIAEEILARGGEVFLIEASASHNLILCQKNLHYIKVESADDMFLEVQKVVKQNEVEVFFSVAAVADFKVKNKVQGKLKKNTLPTIELEKNPDILEYVGNLTTSKPKKVFGFAVEEKENLIKNGKQKLINKKCDFIFANNMQFKTSNTKGYLISNKENIEFEGSKQELAKLLVDKI